MSRRILVADDEAAICEALSKVLQAEKYEVDIAASGNEVIDKIAAGPYDLLLLDLGLPGEEGWATLELLDWVNPLLPVIIITGRSNQREMAERAGASALMEKPLDVPLLLQTIRKLLEEPMVERARREISRGTAAVRQPNASVRFRRALLKQ